MKFTVKKKKELVNSEKTSEQKSAINPSWIFKYYKNDIKKAIHFLHLAAETDKIASHIFYP